MLAKAIESAETIRCAGQGSVQSVQPPATYSSGEEASMFKLSVRRRGDSARVSASGARDDTGDSDNGERTHMRLYGGSGSGISKSVRCVAIATTLRLAISAARNVINVA